MNTPIQLNGSKLVRDVRRLAREQPTRLASCRNVSLRNGEYVGECIVGTALLDDGRIDGRTLSGCGSFAPMVREGEFQTARCSQRYGRWLQAAQTAQDSGKTWANAIVVADQTEGKVW